MGEREKSHGHRPERDFPIALRAIFSDPNADGYVLIPVIPYAVIEIWQRVGVPIQKILGNWTDLRTAAKGRPVVMVLLGGKRWLDQLKELGGGGHRCGQLARSGGQSPGGPGADLSTAKRGIKCDSDIIFSPSRLATCALAIFYLGTLAHFWHFL